MSRKRLRLTLTYAALTLISLIYLSPFFWMLVQSLHSLADFYARPPLWPVPPQWQNYSILLTEPTFVRAGLNSIVVSAAIATLQVGASALAGFAFAVLEF